MEYTIYIAPSRLKVFPQLSPNDLITLRNKTRYKPEGYQYSNAYQMRAWDGYKFLVHKDQTAPSPLYLKIEKILKELGHEVSIAWENDFAPKGKAEVHTLTLDDLQQDAIKKAIKFRYCAIEAAIRSGKTAMTAGMFNRIGHFPGFLVTQGKDLVVQTRDEFRKFLDVKVGYFSESKFELGDIIVTSYAALSRLYGSKTKTFEERNRTIRELVKKTKVLILDECHHAFGEKAKKTLENFSNIGYKISVSGTVKPDKTKRVETEAIVGKIVKQIKFEKLIEKGRIAKPRIIFYNMPRLWYRDYLPEFRDIYPANIVENDPRNQFIAKLVEKAKEKGKNVFIMVRRKAHGEILSSLIPDAVYVWSKTDAETRKSLYENLNNKSLSCIIATVGKEGLNIPKLDIVINAEGYKGEVVTVQKMRSLTGDKTKSVGIVIDFHDHGKYLEDHSVARLLKYESLKGFEIRHKKVPKDILNEQ